MKQRYYQTMIEQAELFGLENRLLQCTEECGELIQALSKYQRILQGDKTCQTDMAHAEYMIEEEVADVELLLEQIKYLLGNIEQVKQIKAEKIQRTAQRLLFGDEEEQNTIITSYDETVWQYNGSFYGCPDWVEEAIECGVIGRNHNLKAVLERNQNYVKTPKGNIQITVGDYLVKERDGSISVVDIQARYIHK